MWRDAEVEHRLIRAAWRTVSSSLAEVRFVVMDTGRAAELRGITWEGAPEQWQCQLLRCVFGQPFQPPIALDSSWMTWNGGTVRGLADAIYAEPAFDRLPILADALEEAGCTDSNILDHCRGPGPHVRGCWVIDLVLGKE